MKGVIIMKKRVLSQKAQALSEFVSSMVMIILFICGMLEKIYHTRVFHYIINVLSPLILIGIVFFCAMSTKYKKQPSDELSRELMLKATDIAVRVELCAALLVGIFMHLHGNHRHFEYYSIEGSDVCIFAVFLCGVFLAAKNITFLWLDRTPKAEEDE